MKPNVFRPEYREPTESEKEEVKAIKQKAAQLYDLLSIEPTAPGAREMALARTNLEQAVMWATKAITG